MAEIHVKFDTKTKKAVATVDGKELADFHSMHLHKSYADDMGGSSDDGAYACQISTAKRDAEHKMSQHTHLVACESAEGEAVKHTAIASKEFPEFFEVAETEAPQVQKDIEAFFTKKV